MPPKLASLLTWAFIIWLFRRDKREKPNVTSALWVPFSWMVILCSRPVTQWMSMFGLPVFGGTSVEDGSPIDATFYFTLIAIGICVLAKRRVSLSEIVRNNIWLAIFLLYCFLAVFWSDFLFVAFKRWLKDLGTPIMVLILLTEPDPEEALKRFVKRCAYVLVPLSILFIKYYPQWGRAFGEWSGAAQACGVATSKNSLGIICFVFGFFFFWQLLNTWKLKKTKARRDELLLCGGFLWMICWLFWGLDCGTALMSLVVGISIVALVSLPNVNRKMIGAYIVAGALALLVAQWTLGIFDDVLDLLGKDPTLTGRTELWQELVHFNINPVFGTGFESFWLGKRFETLAAEHWWKPNEAHNGYLETYLNLGVLGLLLLAGLIIATYRKSRLELLRNFEWGRFRLGLLFAILVYNWTEAAFKSLHPVFLVFYIIAMDYPMRQSVPIVESIRETHSEAEQPALTPVAANSIVTN